MFSVRFKHKKNEENIEYTKNHRLKELLDSRLGTYNTPDDITLLNNNQVIQLKHHEKISRTIRKDTAVATSEFFKSFFDMEDELNKFAKDQFIKRINMMECTSGMCGTVVGKIIFPEGEFINFVHITVRLDKIKKLFKSKMVRTIDVEIFKFDIKNNF